MREVVLDIRNTKAMTSAAMLETMWAVGRQDMLDLITPFIEYAVAQTAEQSKVVDIKKVSEVIKAEFAYREFPESIVKKVLNRLSPQYFEKDHGQYILKVSLVDKMEKLRSKRIQCEERIDAVSSVLAKYLESHCRGNFVCSSGQAVEFLQGFFVRYGICVGADRIALESISPKEYEVNYYIAQFIAENERDGTKEYNYIIDLVKGYYLSTVIYLQPDNANIKSQGYGNVCFYYDTRVLLQILGYLSDRERDSTRELHEMLKRHGGSFAFFPQNDEEIRSILSAYQASLFGRKSSQTLEGLDGRKYDWHGVERLKSTFTSRLKSEFQIGRVPLPAYHQNPDGTVRIDHDTIDETALKAFVKDEMGHYNDDRLDSDIASALAIHRLRGKRLTPNVETCAAVFVTTNDAYARAFGKYYDKNVLQNTFPLVISESDLSAIAWVKAGGYDNLIPQRRLLANAYMAMQPPPQFLERLRTVVLQMREEGAITEDAALILRSDAFIAKEMNLNAMGDPNLVTKELVYDMYRRHKERIVFEQKNEERERANQRMEKAIRKAHDEAERKKKIFLKRTLLASKIASTILCAFCAFMLILSWGRIVLTVGFLAVSIPSLLSLYDTLFSRTRRVEQWLEKQANKYETQIFEEKKKEYLSILRDDYRSK